MTLEEIRALVKDDLASVNDVIRARLKSAVPLVDQIAEHIISGGGKRLRPMLVVLAGRACGHKGSAHVEAAAFIEFIHTATLLHDDVVDGSSLRRGRTTANEVFAPPEDEVAFARKIIAAFDQPENRGKGVITVEGRMVELLHAEMARRTVAIAEAIARMGAS